MKDIPEMTVREHHELSMGVLAMCFPYVPKYLQIAILQAAHSAKVMGMKIEPDNLLTGEPLHAEIRTTTE
jgi:hypothetical protein